jgi:beta-galactosidase
LDAARLTNNPQSAIAPVITPNWDDVVYVTATLVDAADNVIPDSATTVRFAVEAAVPILGVDKGNVLDHDSFQATDRKLYDGNTIAILQSTSQSKSITLTAC